MGSGGMLLREIPFNSFQMAFFASLKDLIPMQNSSLQSATLGLLASLLAAVLTQPADVIKTRLMTDKRGSTGRQTIYTEFMRILHEDGLQGLFVGLKARILLCTIGGLIYFYVADFVNSNFIVFSSASH